MWLKSLAVSIIGALALSCGTGQQNGVESVAAVPCDRACLKGIVDQYLAAMVAHDYANLPLAENVKYTEDTATIPLGEGLWVGASGGPTDFGIYALDPESWQAGYFGVMQEFDRPVLLALRLKVANGEITEIEHVVARNLGQASLANLQEPRPAFLRTVPPEERVSREEMYRIANSYFDAIEHSDGDLAPFADDCIRHENGTRTTSKPAPNLADYGPSEADRIRLANALVDALNCKDNISSGILTYITHIQPRRLVIIDEELGLVYGFPMFVHRGDVRMHTITGVPGVTTIPRNFGPINLQAGEIFKISGGQIHEIEANGFLLPYGASSGWDD